MKITHKSLLIVGASLLAAAGCGSAHDAPVGPLPLDDGGDGGDGGTPSLGQPVYYFPWYDNLPTTVGGGNDWLLVTDVAPEGSPPATVEIWFAGAKKADLTIDPETSKPWIAPAPGLQGGPVKVISTNGQPLLTSQRVINHDTFDEVIGVSEHDIESEYYFTWYDDLPADVGAGGDWVTVANVAQEGSPPAAVEIYIAGAKKADLTVPAGTTKPWIASGLAGGPVRVVSTNGQPLIVSQRVLWGTSFNEVLGVGRSKLTADSYFAWFDHTSPGVADFILIANADPAKTANVTIEIGGVKVGCDGSGAPIAIAPGDPSKACTPAVIGGPVVVHSNGAPIIASRRTLFKSASFDEIQGVPRLPTGRQQYWLPWVDSNSGHGSGWIMVANLGPTASESDVRVGKRPGWPISADVGKVGNWLLFALCDGPLVIAPREDGPKVVSQRSVFGNSFNEVVAVPLPVPPSHDAGAAH